MSGELLLRDVEVGGRRVDVRVRDAEVAEVAPGLRPATAGAVVVEGRGGALLPGLHDHHVHLLATAAARASVAVGPADVGDAAGFAAALRGAAAARPPGCWVRAVGYDESVAGDLDRDRLDALVPDRPVRVQHRTGARWVLNSAAIADAGLEGADHPGVERDGTGRPTGRVDRADAWLRRRLPEVGPPDLAPVGAELARYGVTGVTDATPYDDPEDLAALAAAACALPQRLVVTGGPALAATPAPPGAERGPVKLVLDDARDPDLDALVAGIAAAHDAGRSVAVHCVTRAALALALAAWAAAGSRPGDRVEHGSVVPPEAAGRLADLGLTVVTQPALVHERGDRYLADVDPDDRPHLYPCRRLLDAGVEVAAGSDAPYGGTDPWAAMRAAVERRTRSGAPLGPDEAVTPAQALALWLGAPLRPGGPPRRVAPGAPADLCLLHGPPPRTADDLTAAAVRLTVVAGRVVHP